MVCRDNRIVRCSCTAQNVIRQAADVFVSGRFGDSEFFFFFGGGGAILLRNKRCSLAQQRGSRLCKAVGGVR